MLKNKPNRTILDDLIVLDISFLRKKGYLINNNLKTGEIYWICDNKKICSINVFSNTYASQFYIELSYSYKKKTFNYKIKLTQIQSNLGKGKVWYFICPNTERKCRKLYLYELRFYSRFAFLNGLYKNQIRSKKERILDNTFWKYLNAEKYYDEIEQKNLKRHYKGKITKKYSKLVQMIEQAESITASQIQSALMDFL